MPKITTVQLEHSQITDSLHHVGLSFKGEGAFSYNTPLEIMGGDEATNELGMFIYSLSTVSMALSGLCQSTSSNHFCAFMYDDDNEIDVATEVHEYEDENMDLDDEDYIEPDDEEDR
jgi:hypothetical protein